MCTEHAVRNNERSQRVRQWLAHVQAVGARTEFALHQDAHGARGTIARSCSFGEPSLLKATALMYCTDQVSTYEFIPLTIVSITVPRRKAKTELDTTNGLYSTKRAHIATLSAFKALGKARKPLENPQLSRPGCTVRGVVGVRP